MGKKNRFWIEKYLSSGSFCFALLFTMQNSILINWNPNTESDLAGYKIYYGNKSKEYSTIIDVGFVNSYSLENLEGNKNYYFSVTAYDIYNNESMFSRETSVFLEKNEDNDQIVNQLTSEKCYNFPNPFTPNKEVTNLRYVLTDAQLVTIKIYNVQGECIKIIIENEHKSIGEHLNDTWDGKNSDGQQVQNGVYYCLIQTVSRKDYITIAVIN